VGNGGGEKEGTNCPEIQAHYVYLLDHLLKAVTCMKVGPTQRESWMSKSGSSAFILLLLSRKSSEEHEVKEINFPRLSKHR